MKEIFIGREHLEEIIQHAMDARPNEACGILAGRHGTVERVFRMFNTDASPVSYAFDSAEQMNMMRDLEREGLVLVAVYHSHPSSPAYPSQIDIQRAFFPGTEEPNYPDIVYVIIGLIESEPEVKAYSISRKREIFDVRIRTRLS